MTGRRSAGRLLSAVGLAGAGALGFASPAAAASGDSVTIDNAASLTIHAGQPLSVASIAKATCRVGLASRPLTLSLTGPSGTSPTTQTVKTDHAPCSRDASLVTSIASPKRNGSYVLTLTNGAANTAAATLDVLIPPARTQGFIVTTAGTTATFSWTANSEPDVTSYQIRNAAGGVVAAPSAAAACAGGSGCTSSLDLGSGAKGTTEKFSVRAVRCGLSCSGGGLTGASSASASATFAADPATPTPTPSATGSGNGDGNGNGNGSHGGNHHGNGATTGGGKAATGNAARPAGRAQHSNRSRQTTGHRFTLPTLRAGALPRLQTKAVTGIAGKPQLPAPRASTSAAPRSATSAISHDVATGLHLPPLWRGIAAAAVLLLIALHLRTWASRVELR